MNDIEPLSSDAAEKTIGLTTTVPVEVVFAAGLRPLDLNNVFIASGEAPRLVQEAEREGFPRNACAWNKGIYAAARRLGLRRIVGVVQGDCANTHAMLERLRAEGVEVVPFAFPYDPSDREFLQLALDRFCRALGTDMAAAMAWKEKLDQIRALVHRIDDLSWEKGVVTGAEAHRWTISCSDFNGDPDAFAAEARQFLEIAEAREAAGGEKTRLALVGIPPICDGLFEFLEDRGARVIFNEIPRQFSMPFETADLLEQYSRYTYPYDIFRRLEDITREIARRRADAVIHYVQSFCFRQVQDTLIRRAVGVPVLTLEGDRPGPLDMRTETRIEAFLEMLRGLA